jgi:hypothetical protein
LGLGGGGLLEFLESGEGLIESSPSRREFGLEVGGLVTSGFSDGALRTELRLGLLEFLAGLPAVRPRKPMMTSSESPPAISQVSLFMAPI